MKTICLLLTLMLLLPMHLLAQSNTLSVPLIGTVDLNSFVQNSGGILAYDNHGTKWAGASMRVAWVPADPAKALITGEAGVLWDAVSGSPSGLSTAIGVRLDNVAAKFDAINFIKDNIGHLPVPALEVGPFAAYLTTQKRFVYGAFIAKKFGA